MARRRRRRTRRRFTSTRTRVIGLAVTLFAVGWSTHPVWTSLAVIAAVSAVVGWWLLQREQLRAAGERTWLYRHWGWDGRLLYVGITNDYRRRCEQHADTKWWWPQVNPAWSTTQKFPNRLAALAAEKAAIRFERPVYNIAHNGRRIAA